MDNTYRSSDDGGTNDLTAQFGRLSTNATEWTPTASTSAASTRASHQQPQPFAQSDLSAAQVKEFVPGQGWASAATSTSAGTTASSMPAADQQQQSLYQQQYQQQQPFLPSMPQQHANVRIDSSFSQQSSVYVDAEQDPSDHFAPPQPPTDESTTTFPAGPMPPPLPSFRAIHSLGTPDETWNYCRELALESIRQMDPTDERHKEVLPPYCNAYCLDDDKEQQQPTQPPHTHSSTARRSATFGYPCRTFQVTSRQDGHLYCLHRLDNAVRSVSPQICHAILQPWTQTAAVQEHPGIVPLYHCFVAQRAVFFVHQYVPGARTLLERCQSGYYFSEPLLWSCITQLVSAIRTVHASHLAVRSLDMRHVLCNTAGNNDRLRLRLNCVGIMDALEFEARKPVAELQRQDVCDLGWLILSLATGTELSAKTTPRDSSTLQRCESFVAQTFSRELHNLAMTLIGGNTQHAPPSIVDVARAIAQRAFDEGDQAYRAVDFYERQLMAEYESGRCLRLLLKLGFCNERPELGPDRRWSQSGDCYVLTLFRDYVFHQADGAGYPVLDLGHVMTALNKLDAADPEQIVLASRDGKSLMVVTYADVAQCLENAFGELCSKHQPGAAAQPFS